MVIIWETTTGIPLRQFPEYNGAALGVAFTAPGRTLLTAVIEDGIREWRIDCSQSELLECIAANRYIPELTCLQREKYNLAPPCNNNQQPKSTKLSRQN